MKKVKSVPEHIHADEDVVDVFFTPQPPENVESVMRDLEMKFFIVKFADLHDYYAPNETFFLNPANSPTDLIIGIREALLTSYTLGRSSMRDEILAVVPDDKEENCLYSMGYNDCRSQLLAKIGGIE